MSSLTILGDTSGSIVLDAPAVSGSTVLTLPARSGTVMVNGPAFSAYPSANSSAISSGTFVKVTLDSEEFDTNNNFASSRFTPTVAGYYQINGAVSTTAYAGNYLLSVIYKNGSLYKNGSNYALNAAAGPTTIVSSLVYFNGSTDYVELYVIAQGTPQIYGANTYATFLNGSLVRAA